MNVAERDFVVYKFSWEKFAIGVRYHPPDLNYPTDTIQSCTTEVTPAGLSLVGLAFVDEDAVGQTIEGGECNQIYKVHFKTITSTGYKLEDEIIVKVK